MIQTHLSFINRFRWFPFVVSYFSRGFVPPLVFFLLFCSTACLFRTSIFLACRPSVPLWPTASSSPAVTFTFEFYAAKRPNNKSVAFALNTPRDSNFQRGGGRRRLIFLFSFAFSIFIFKFCYNFIRKRKRKTKVQNQNRTKCNTTPLTPPSATNFSSVSL